MATYTSIKAAEEGISTSLESGSTFVSIKKAEGVILARAADTLPDVTVWHDNRDSSLYDGSSYWIGTTDKGAGGYDLNVSPAQASTTMYEIDGTPTLLPGPIVGGSIGEALNISGDGSGVELADGFTVIALIPTGSYASWRRVYWAARDPDGSSYGISIASAVGAYEMRCNTYSGGVEIDAGMFGGNDGGWSILAFRRTRGVSLVADCWYDRNGGLGVEHPAQVSVADPDGDVPTLLEDLYMGGDASGNQWNATGTPPSPLGSVEVYSGPLSDDDLLSVLSERATELGWNPADIAF